MKPKVTRNVPKLIYFNLTKSQTCNDNSSPRGRFEAENGTTYSHLPYVIHCISNFPEFVIKVHAACLTFYLNYDISRLMKNVDFSIFTKDFAKSVIFLHAFHQNFVQMFPICFLLMELSLQKDD